MLTVEQTRSGGWCVMESRTGKTVGYAPTPDVAEWLLDVLQDERRRKAKKVLAKAQTED